MKIVFVIFPQTLHWHFKCLIFHAHGCCCSTCQCEFPFFLIECRKEYFEITWASLRSMVEPSFAERSVINHKDYLVHGNIITSSAVNVTETDVITADGHKIAFDYLVIATGHADDVPKSRRDRLHQFVEGEFEL